MGGATSPVGQVFTWPLFTQWAINKLYKYNWPEILDKVLWKGCMHEWTPIAKSYCHKLWKRYCILTYSCNISVLALVIAVYL